MKSRFLIIFCLLAVSAAGAADSFSRIKERLSSARCVSIEFVSILHSDVFKSVDSTSGSVYLARDGRYTVKVGDDVYLYDRHNTYEYSASNNQVLVSPADSVAGGRAELLYITRLDELYKTAILEPGKVYKLTRKGNESSPLPDSMTVVIDQKKERIVRIEYLDINDERVTLLLSRESEPATCDESRFVPQFPDSVETIKM